MTAATDWNDHFITKLQEEIAQQEQLVRRMIVRGAPTTGKSAHPRGTGSLHASFS
jgi:hypothetical protein